MFKLASKLHKNRLSEYNEIIKINLFLFFIHVGKFEKQEILDIFSSKHILKMTFSLICYLVYDLKDKP